MKRRSQLPRSRTSHSAQREILPQPGATTVHLQRARWHWPTVLAGALLVAMTVVTYAPTFWNQYIWDDDAYVTGNLTIRSLPGLQAMWFKPHSLPQYYPLVHTTYWIEYHLWKLQPLGYHIVNVLLHATAAVLAWRLFLRLRIPGAWLAAAIFAVHPVMVESVAWITERKNVLSLPLALGSMLCYLRYAPTEAGERASTPRRTRYAYYVAALGLFIAALLSKTVVASMPAVLLVIYWWKRGAIHWGDVARLAPFFAVGAGLGAHTAQLERFHVGAIGESWDFSVADRVLIAGRAVWFYAAKLAWPHPIIFFYPRWQIDDHAWWQYLYPAAALALLASLWLARRTIGRGPLAAALIFGGVLMPALGFLNVYPFLFSFVADHFQYHASLALIALGGASLALAAQTFVAPAGRAGPTEAPAQTAEDQAYQPASRGAGVVTASVVATWVAAGALLVTLATISFRQTFTYYDVHTLYADVIEKNPDAWIAYVNLGAQLMLDKKRDEALEMFHKVTRLEPNHYRAHSAYALVLHVLGERDGFKPGQVEEAISHFEEALRIKPTYTRAREGLARVYLNQRKLDLARDQLNLVFEQQPRSVSALLLMGWLLIEEQQWSEAQSYFERVIELKPDVFDARLGLGLALDHQGKRQEAVGHLEKAIEIDPRSSRAHYVLGTARLNLNETPAAVEQFQQALEITPDNLEALSNLGVAYGILGDADRSIECFERILKVDPNYNGAAENLKRARDMKGKE